MSEFYQYKITDVVLEGVIANLRPERSLYYKMSDLKVLLKAFDEAMGSSYMVTEQILTLLKEVAQES